MGRTGSVAALVASCMMLVGCGSQAQGPANGVAYHIDLRLTPELDDDIIDELLSAEVAWETALGDVDIAITIASDDPNVTEIGLGKQNGYFALASLRSTIDDHYGFINFSTDIPRENMTLRYVARHELGHLLGCWTHQDIGNVMCGDRDCLTGVNHTEITAIDLKCIDDGDARFDLK